MAESLLAIEAGGLDELMAGLRGAAQGLGREQRRANKEVAVQAAAWAQSAARGGSRQQARAASAIKPRSTQQTARLAISGGPPYARAAFWGMVQRSGWYGRARYASSTGKQAPPWVGNAWVAGVKGEGPHVINAALADHVDDIEALYALAYERALKQAFPGGFG